MAMSNAPYDPVAIGQGNKSTEDLKLDKHNNSDEGNECMDKYKLVANDEKEKSAEEDWLGTQSLLMPESDEEESESSVVVENQAVQLDHKVQPDQKMKPDPEVQPDEVMKPEAEVQPDQQKKPDQEVQPEAEVQPDHQMETDQETRTVICELNMKRTKRIIDSDEEAEYSIKVQPESVHTDSEREDIHLNKNIIPAKKRRAVLFDSDDEEDSFQIPAGYKVSEENIISATYSDNCQQTADVDAKKSMNEKLKADKTEDNIKSGIQKLKMCSLVDTDSEAELSDAEEIAENSPSKLNDSPIKQHKHIRASAKKAMDEMQAIQSEQQRLHRETLISIPYHKPKRFTLQEFLKRHTNIKLEASKEDKALPSKNLKMTTEELEDYAKLMDDRAKEATEFFKSESEEEEFKENMEIIDKESTNSDVKQEDTVIDNEKITELETEDTNVNKKITENNTPPDDDLPPSSKPVILSVVELPKLDINSISVPSTASPKPATSSLKSIETVKHLITKNNLNENPSIKGYPNMLIDLDTGDIIPPTASQKPATFTRKSIETVKRLFTENMLNQSPSLKSYPNMLIDLETGDVIPKQPTGVDNLMQRLLSTSRTRKTKSSNSVNILSTDNGKLEISKVNIKIAEDSDPQSEHKPGAAYFKLQENLKSIIFKKRLEGIQKKLEEDKEYRKCLDDDDDDDGDYNDDYDDTNKDGDDNDVDEFESKQKSKTVNNKDFLSVNDDEETLEIDDDEHSEENDIETQMDTNDEDIKDNVVDGKYEESGTPNDANSESSVESEDDSDEDTDADNENEDTDDDDRDNYKKNSKTTCRIIKGFQDDSDDENGMDANLLMPPPALPTVVTCFEDNYFKTSPGNAETELLALCSGQFETQSSGTPIISQIPITQICSKSDASTELLELCSGTFDDDIGSKDVNNELQDSQNFVHTQSAFTTTQKSNNTRKIVSSDEEDSTDKANAESSLISGTQKRGKKLTKKIKKKRCKLGFSDDEGDEEVEAVGEVYDVEEFEAAVEEEPATYIDYDSEENEIVVQMTKTDRVKQAEIFVDNEAELSESEWGSADEDEKNFDKYDIELGDEDEFDREKLQTELGQIHARKMLDEDIREVRKIQEMLFEDEETDGVGRQRQFKWKHAESGFSLDETNRPENRDDGNGGSGDEENEHLWRKKRFEREQLLREQGLTEDFASNATLSPSFSVTISKTPTIVKKVNIITKKKTSTLQVNQSSQFLISNNSTTILKKVTRGSFLERGKETLTKLAGLTTKGNSGVAHDADRTVGTVSVKTIKPKNFVFSTLTHEEHENLKRKADDVINSSNENGVNYMKKPRMEPNRDKCFIDQLL